MRIHLRDHKAQSHQLVHAGPKVLDSHACIGAVKLSKQLRFSHIIAIVLNRLRLDSL